MLPFFLEIYGKMRIIPDGGFYVRISSVIH